MHNEVGVPKPANLVNFSFLTLLQLTKQYEAKLWEVGRHVKKLDVSKFLCITQVSVGND